MNSNQRILEIYFRLFQGEKLRLEQLAEQYHVSKRTLQRDLAAISEASSTADIGQAITYHSKEGWYILDTLDRFTPQEILIIGKILLESRALTKNELTAILNHLLLELSSDPRQQVKLAMANELLGYYPLKHQENLLQLVWDFSRYISEQRTLAFDYRKNSGAFVKGCGLPVSLYFSEYYFYVLLFNPTYQSYVTYRLDRFGSIIETAETIRIPYKDRLKDSELRKKMYFMYAGKEVTFTFRFWGIAEAALDKLPESKIIRTHTDSSVTIEATAYDTGVIMWLLSQGSNVHVLSPPSFVEKIKVEIQQMNQRYLG